MRSKLWFFCLFNVVLFSACNINEGNGTQNVNNAVSPGVGNNSTANQVPPKDVKAEEAAKLQQKNAELEQQLQDQQKARLEEERARLDERAAQQEQFNRMQEQLNALQRDRSTRSVPEPQAGSRYNYPSNDSTQYRPPSQSDPGVPRQTASGFSGGGSQYPQSSGYPLSSQANPPTSEQAGIPRNLPCNSGAVREPKEKLSWCERHPKLCKVGKVALIVGGGAGGGAAVGGRKGAAIGGGVGLGVGLTSNKTTQNEGWH